MSVINGYCPNCKASRAFERKDVNHILHAALTLLTCFWIVIWLAAILQNKSESYQCRECGTEKP